MPLGLETSCTPCVTPRSLATSRSTVVPSCTPEYSVLWDGIIKAVNVNSKTQSLRFQTVCPVFLLYITSISLPAICHWPAQLPRAFHCCTTGSPPHVHCTHSKLCIRAGPLTVVIGGLVKKKGENQKSIPQAYNVSEWFSGCRFRPSSGETTICVLETWKLAGTTSSPASIGRISRCTIVICYAAHGSPGSISAQ